MQHTLKCTTLFWLLTINQTEDSFIQLHSKIIQNKYVQCGHYWKKIPFYWNIPEIRNENLQKDVNKSKMRSFFIGILWEMKAFEKEWDQQWNRKPSQTRTNR